MLKMHLFDQSERTNMKKMEKKKKEKKERKMSWHFVFTS